MQSTKYIKLLESGVHEFVMFMQHVKCAIRHREALGSLYSFLFLMKDEVERFEIKGVHHVFCVLLVKLELCQKELEILLGLVNKERGEPIVCCWS